MITVGELRKAMVGLPENAPVHLQFLNDPEPFVDVEFEEVTGSHNDQLGPHLVIAAVTHDPEDEDDEEDEGDDL